MKRILATLAIVALLATTAQAAIVSYNPSYGQPIRTISTWYSGYNIVRVVTVTQPNGCKTVTTTYYAFWIKTNETVETVCP